MSCLTSLFFRFSMRSPAFGAFLSTKLVSCNLGSFRSSYEKHGFLEWPPFANYVLEPSNIFMSLELRKS